MLEFHVIIKCFFFGYKILKLYRPILVPCNYQFRRDTFVLKRRASSYYALQRGFYTDVVNTETLKVYWRATVYSYSGSSRFSSVNSGKFRDRISIRPQSLPFNMFIVHYLPVAPPFAAIYIAILTASKINYKNVPPKFAQVTCLPPWRQSRMSAHRLRSDPVSVARVRKLG